MNSIQKSNPVQEPDSNRDDSLENTPFAPSTRELERLLFTIESSLQVNRRFQFFLWAQGVLQAFLPHQTLICVLGNLEAGIYKTEVCASDLVQQGADPESEPAIQVLVDASIQSWIQRGRQPICIGSKEDIIEQNMAVNSAILELGLGNVMAHGTKEFSTNGSFFIFGRMSKKPGRRSTSLFESLVPILHFALNRYLQNEDAQHQSETNRTSLLSDREVQIVQAACLGKTNSEIGVELDISPLTVKNHMQRILRKLNVNNRAQAVAKCISLGLFERRHNK
jgi:transcriptional regulator EpsA